MTSCTILPRRCTKLYLKQECPINQDISFVPRVCTGQIPLYPICYRYSAKLAYISFLSFSAKHCHLIPIYLRRLTLMVDLISLGLAMEFGISIWMLIWDSDIQCTLLCVYVYDRDRESVSWCHRRCRSGD